MNVEGTQFKQQAANRAVEYIESGMAVGLGHGSTAILAVRRLAELLQAGKLREIVGIPCSIYTEKEAKRLGIPLTTLEKHPVVDLTIDGADEVALNLDLIKGGGGAFLREKIVAQASRFEIIIVDESKLSPALGTHCAVPVEVLSFGWRSQANYLESLGARVTVRNATSHGKDAPIKTDQGNMILDCNFGALSEPAHLAIQLNERAGIVAHGLFLGLATEVIVSASEGVRHLKRDVAIEKSSERSEQRWI